MKVGDKVSFVPTALAYEAKSKLRAEPVWGVVIWLHPLGRFAVVERKARYYTYRECVWLTRAERRMLNENYRNHEPERRGGKNRYSA